MANGVSCTLQTTGAFWHCVTMSLCHTGPGDNKFRTFDRISSHWVRDSNGISELPSWSYFVKTALLEVVQRSHYSPCTENKPQDLSPWDIHGDRHPNQEMTHDGEIFCPRNLMKTFNLHSDTGTMIWWSNRFSNTSHFPDMAGGPGIHNEFREKETREQKRNEKSVTWTTWDTWVSSSGLAKQTRRPRRRWEFWITRNYLRRRPHFSLYMVEERKNIFIAAL